MKVNVNGQEKIAQWRGEVNPADPNGLQKGVLSDGTEVQWNRVDEFESVPKPGDWGAATLPTTGLAGDSLRSAFTSAPAGVSKDVFYGGKLFQNVEVKSINGIDTARLPNGAIVEYNGQGWQLGQGQVAPEQFDMFGLSVTGGPAHLLKGLFWSKQTTYYFS
jgi:hypothetical protein